MMNSLRKLYTRALIMQWVTHLAGSECIPTVTQTVQIMAKGKDISLVWMLLSALLYRKVSRHIILR